MTTRYRMTTDVQAWRVGEDGSLPNAARYALEFRLEDYNGPDDDDPTWSRWGLESKVIARPGDWIVQNGYVLEAMTDEAFRARCVEVQEP